MLMQEERELIVEYGKKLSASGLCPGTSGNISIYNAEKNLMAISPSGMDYIVDGSRKPSSEWALHTIFYKHKPEARAVVHTHSAYCTTFAVLNQPIRAVHYVIGDANTDVVPCAPYITFGTEELAEKAIEVCGDSNAVLLANHGIVVCGSSIASAFSLANNMEYIAKLQYRAMCIGQPQILTDEQMAVVMEKFKSYGQPGSHKSGY